MSERDFMLIIRRALLMICAAIEKRYNINSKHDIMPQETE
jgi:hypothetical protein